MNQCLIFFKKSPVTLYGGINFFFGLCTTFVICLLLKKFFIFSVLLFTWLGVSGGRSLVRDMVGTEFPDVAFGQSLLASSLSGFSSFIYILPMELSERWYDTSIEGTHTRFQKCGDNIFRTVGL